MFLDYNQNAKDRTVASAYSVRPLPDARVSTPLTWDEVPTVEAEAFTIATVPDRFASIGDPGRRHRRCRRLARSAARAVAPARGRGRGRRAVAAELREAGRRAAAGPAIPEAPARLGVRAGPRRGRRAAAGGRRGTGRRGRGGRPECRPADRVGRLTPDPDRPAQDEHPGHRDLARRLEGGSARRLRTLEGPPPEGRRCPGAGRRPRRRHARPLIAVVSRPRQPDPRPGRRTARPGSPRPRLRPVGGVRMSRPGERGRIGRGRRSAARRSRTPDGQARWRRRMPKAPSQRRTNGSHAALTSAWAPTAMTSSSPGTASAKAGTTHSMSPKPAKEASIRASMPSGS